jgi:hypothetical protein
MAPQKRGIVSNVTKAVAQRVSGARRQLRKGTQFIRRVGGRNVRGERGGGRGGRGIFRRGR